MTKCLLLLQIVDDVFTSSQSTCIFRSITHDFITFQGHTQTDSRTTHTDVCTLCTAGPVLDTPWPVRGCGRTGARRTLSRATRGGSARHQPRVPHLPSTKVRFSPWARTRSRATRGGECLAPTSSATSHLDSGSSTHHGVTAQWRRTRSRATRGGEYLAPTTCATSPLDPGSPWHELMVPRMTSSSTCHEDFSALRALDRFISVQRSSRVRPTPTRD